jgi:hypothetical protein
LLLILSFQLSRTIKDKKRKHRPSIHSKNRNGPDGLSFLFLWILGNVKIEVLEQLVRLLETLKWKVPKKKRNLKERYKKFRKTEEKLMELPKSNTYQISQCT